MKYVQIRLCIIMELMQMYTYFCFAALEQCIFIRISYSHSIMLNLTLAAYMT